MGKMPGVKCPKCGAKTLYTDTDLTFAVQEDAISAKGASGLDASMFMVGAGSSTYCICNTCGCGAKVVLTDYGGVAHKVPDSLVEKAKERKAKAQASVSAANASGSGKTKPPEALYWAGTAALIGLIGGLFFGGFDVVFAIGCAVFFALMGWAAYALDQFKKK